MEYVIAAVFVGFIIYVGYKVFMKRKAKAEEVDTPDDTPKEPKKKG